MMDTVLNLGLNDVTVKALARNAGDERFAYDSYRRFIQMYSSVVLGIGHHHFEDAVEYHKEARGVSLDTELGAEDWEKLIVAFKAKVARGQRQAISASAAGAIMGRHRRRFRLMADAARDHLPAHPRHSGELGHGRHCAGHGVRQHGPDVGDRGRLHPQSIDGGEGALWRIPPQRAGRGRRRRHSDAECDYRGEPSRRGLRPAFVGDRAAGRLRRIRAHDGAARTPLPRHAGRGVHRRKRQAMDVADPHRQTHQRRGAARRGRHDA